MFKISPLHRALHKAFNFGQWRDPRHLATFCQMVCGLIQSESSHRNRWVPFACSRAKFAHSKVRRFMRWLRNDAIEVHSLYAAMIASALESWQSSQLFLTLDTSHWGELCQIALNVVYRGRAVPLVWKDLKHNSSMVAFHEYAALLRAAKNVLPKGVDIILRADRGFADIELMALCVKLGWHYRLRIKSNFHVYQGDKKLGSVAELNLPVGTQRFLQGVSITEQRYGPVNLALGHSPDSKEKWYVASDEATGSSTFGEYGSRFTIEEFFLDEKSNGFDLEHSALHCPKALTRLLLVHAAAILYLVSQGTQVVSSGQRRAMDPHWFRGSSYLRIGWNWVKAALIHGWHLIARICLGKSEDPEPAMASRIQHEKRLKKRAWRNFSLSPGNFAEPSTQLTDKYRNVTFESRPCRHLMRSYRMAR